MAIGIDARSVVPIRSRAGRASPGCSTASRVMAFALSSSRMPAALPAIWSCRSWALRCWGGFRLLTASGDDLTDSDDLGRKMMRGVAGDFMEYEEGRLLAKLRAAGNARRPARGRRLASEGEGQYRPHELPCNQFQAEDAGYCNERGEPFNPHSVRAMIEGPPARPPRACFRLRRSSGPKITRDSCALDS